MGVLKRGKSNDTGKRTDKKRLRHGSEASGLKKARFQDVAMLPVSGAQAAEEHEASFPRSRRAAVSHDKKVETFDVAPSDHDDDADMLQRKYHLSYADLTPGSVVMGSVASYSDDEKALEIHLPFHLRGYVPLSHTVEDDEDVSAPDSRQVRRYYRRGMYVICVVISQESHRLVLSLRPSLINAGYSFALLRPGMWLPATVKTFEEFGCTISFGLPETISAYVRRDVVSSSSSSHSASDAWSFLEPGCVTYVGITEVNLNGNSVMCTLAPNGPALAAHISLDRSLLRAGLLVEAKVMKVVSSKETKKSSKTNFPLGLSVTLCRVLKAVVPGLHTWRPKGSSIATGSLEHIKVGSTISVRVIATCFSKNCFIVSPLASFVNWCPPSVSHELISIPVGARLTSCEVVAVNPSFGVRLSVKVQNKCFVADVPRERCVDANIGQTTTKGKLLLTDFFDLHQLIPQARVVSHNFFDGALMVVTAPSLLTERFFLPKDVSPGQYVEGTIQHISEGCVFVKLSSHLVGLLPRDHLTDLPLTELPKHIQMHKTIKTRVFSVDRGTIWLTAKRSMMLDSRPALGVNFELDFEKNQLVTGVVGPVHPDKPTVVVYFFQRAHGYVPKDDFEKFQKLDRCRQGCVLQCKVVDVNIFTKTLNLMLDLHVDKVSSENQPQQTVTPFEQCAQWVRSLAHLRLKFSDGCSLSEFFDALDSLLPSSLKYVRLPGGNNHFEDNTRFVVPSMANIQRIVKPGVVLNEILAFLGTLCGHAVVLFSVRATLAGKVLEDDALLPISRVDEDGDVLGLSFRDDAQDVRLVGLGFIPFSHLADDQGATQETTKILTEQFTCSENKALSDQTLKTLSCTAVVLDFSSRICLSQPSEEQRFGDAPQNDAFEAPRLITEQLDKGHDCVYGPLLSMKPSCVASSQCENNTFVTRVDQLDASLGCWRLGYILRVFKKTVLVSCGYARIAALAISVRDQNSERDERRSNFSSCTSTDQFVVGQTVWVRITEKVMNETAPSTSHKGVTVAFKGQVRLWVPGEDPNATADAVAKLTSQNATLAVGDRFPGVVKKTTLTSVWVTLEGPGVDVRLPIETLPESPLDPVFVASLYPPKRFLPSVRLVRIDEEHGIVGSCCADPFDCLNVGDLVNGSVKKRLPSGLILAVRALKQRGESGSCDNVDAFCHVSQIDDSELNGSTDRATQRRQWRQLLMKYSVGSRVKAKIIELTRQPQRRITVTLRPSEVCAA